MRLNEGFGTAIALLEYQSIAAGIEAGDAMVKRAPLEVIHAGTAHPGKYLILVGGGVADVEEATEAAHLLGTDSLLSELFLADPHPELVAAVRGSTMPPAGEALGILETTSVAEVLRAADAGRKGAAVTIRQIFLADGLGGKGYLLFSGPLSEVQTAIEIGADTVADGLVGQRVIAQLHDEMAANLNDDGRFASRVRGV